MRKRLTIVLAVLLLVVVGTIGWLSLRPDEPMYNGKRLSVWLKGYDGSYRSFSGSNYNSGFSNSGFSYVENATGRAEADEAVRHIGTNAIPMLLQKLRAKDSPFKVKLHALAQKLPLIKVYHTPAWFQQKQGCRGFLVLG